VIQRRRPGGGGGSGVDLPEAARTERKGNNDPSSQETKGKKLGLILGPYVHNVDGENRRIVGFKMDVRTAGCSTAADLAPISGRLVER
jgi:hypothetical protein